MNKKWDIRYILQQSNTSIPPEDIVTLLLENRGMKEGSTRNVFLAPKDPYAFSAEDVSIDQDQLMEAVKRIEKRIKNEESMVVYADYDADGVTAGAVLWETLHALGAKVMPYVPHRVDEGYGLSNSGIDAVEKEYKATLIITVDHGISAWEKVAYAKKKGIDVIVTDHHTKPEKLPNCPIVHTTAISGAGVSWFVAKTLLERNEKLLKKPFSREDLLGLTAIGTIADLLPLTGPNRSIARYGLKNLSTTKRLGILAMMKEAGLEGKVLTTYEVSHILAPRLNALGRLEHAIDALRLLCTTNEERAISLATRLGEVNRERQTLTLESTLHARQRVLDEHMGDLKKILIVAEEMYNPGIIGLVAGRLVEEHYLPAIVLSKGEHVSKASARSISGFNIVDAIRAQEDLLIDVGGHPMAAGFSIETAKLDEFIARIEAYAQKQITEDMRMRVLPVDLEMPLSFVSAPLYKALQTLMPFGMGNYEPTFVSRGVSLLDARTVGQEGKHLKVKLKKDKHETIDAIAFGLGDMFPRLSKHIDIAYTIDNNAWNGRERIELKLKDLQIITS